MNCNLTLVTLTPGQIAMAKDANGVRKTITHALICGPYGQIFGTEKQCRKYWVAWDPANRPAIFPKLFGKAVETDNYELTNFKTTFDLVNILGEKQDRT